MTNAIEQTRISMYDAFNAMKAGGRWLIKKANCEAFESALEEHLEALRAAMKTREDVGQAFSESLGRVVADRDSLILRLSAMTQERDEIQGRLHAIDHAYGESQKAVSIAGEELRECQTNLRHWREECGKMHAKVRAFESGDIHKKYLRDRQDLMSAEKLSDELSEKLTQATSVIGRQEQLIAGQRHAIAELYMDRARIPREISTYAAWITREYEASKSGNCQHSFQPAFPSGQMCTFCTERRP